MSAPLIDQPRQAFRLFARPTRYPASQTLPRNGYHSRHEAQAGHEGFGGPKNGSRYYRRTSRLADRTENQKETYIPERIRALQDFPDETPVAGSGSFWQLEQCAG